MNSRFTELLRAQGVEPGAIAQGVRRGLIVLNLGNMTGFLSFIPLTNRLGRRTAFAIFHLGAVISMPAAYLFSSDYTTGLILFFIAGLFTSGIYSGYTIYFPELFPTRVRATGASFCYNVGRIVAAPGPVLDGMVDRRAPELRARGTDDRLRRRDHGLFLRAGVRDHPVPAGNARHRSR